MKPKNVQEHHRQKSTTQTVRGIRRPQNAAKCLRQPSDVSDVSDVSDELIERAGLLVPCEPMWTEALAKVRKHSPGLNLLGIFSPLSRTKRGTHPTDLHRGERSFCNQPKTRKTKMSTPYNVNV